MRKASIFYAMFGAAFLCVAPVSLQVSTSVTPSLAIDQAQARIGRPFTPMSVAGVNRRVHRRAYRAHVYGGYAYRPYAYRPYYYRYW